ncbi:MAG: hypothetical protein HY001_03055 [Candidatus Portnoybacteria bacterium]|nr:hypothetical protein [Candidatus Portnoybacteria bacterium]
MQSSKDIILGIITAIFLLAAIVFGVLWMQTKKELRITNQEVSELGRQVQELQTKLAEQKPQTPPKTQQLQNTSTSNWKTYRNEKYGFEVKYPSEWTTKSIGADNDEVTFFKTENQYPIGGVLIRDNEFGAEKIRMIMVNGVARDLMRFADNPCGGFDVNIPYRGKFLVFSVSECAGQCDPEVPGPLRCEKIAADTLLSQILSTFRFIPLEK